jgi:hypothetical protein
MPIKLPNPVKHATTMLITPIAVTTPGRPRLVAYE